MTKDERYVAKLIIVFLAMLAAGCVVIGFVCQKPWLAALCLGFCWGRFMGKQLTKRL